MDLGNSIRKTGKEEVIIKSVIWNIILGIFKAKKNIDIEKYLVSIKLKGENILIKTNKPMINTELYLINDEIKKASQDKFKKLGLLNNDFNIKYL